MVPEVFVDDAFQSRHLLRVDDGGYVVADEEQLRLRVVDDVMYLFGIELMEYGHSYSPVGQRGNKGHGPLAGVASAEGYLVALCHTRVLKQYMQLLNLASYVVELQCLTLEVCQRVEVPESVSASRFQLSIIDFSSSALKLGICSIVYLFSYYMTPYL